MRLLELELATAVTSAGARIEVANGRLGTSSAPIARGVSTEPIWPAPALFR
jgi:4'-phosphopantetheinyl transferase EntD